MTTGRRSFLRPLLIIVLVFGAIWTATIVRWRADNRVPDGVGIAVYLVILPLLVLLSIWGGVKIYKAIKQRKEKAAAPAAAPGEAAPAPNDPSLAWCLPILGFGAVLPAGATADAVLTAATEDKRIDLHPSLRNAAAEPVFAAEVPDLDIDHVRDSLPAAATDWADSRLRTLALAQTLATQTLEAHFDTLRAPPDPARPTARPAAVAELEWWLPVSWDETARKMAGQWLAEQLAEHGWKAPELAVQTRTMRAGSPAWQRLDALNRAYHEETLVLPRLVLAAESFIDEGTLTEWDGQKTLFDGEHNEGRIPGEGAGIVLLGAFGHDKPEPVARLHRLFQGRREHPVDQPRRAQADTLDGLAKHAREHAALPEDTELLLVGDTDTRPTRSTEAMLFAGAVLPEAEPASILRQLGVANGDCGMALTLAMVAAAAHLCAKPQHAAVVFSQHDPSQRLLVMVSAADASSQAQAPEAPSLQASET